MGYIEKGHAKTTTKVILWAVVIAFVGSIFYSYGMKGTSIQGDTSAFSVAGVDVKASEVETYERFYSYVNQAVASSVTRIEFMVWEAISRKVGQSLGGSILQVAQITENNRNYLYSMILTIGDIVLAEEAQKAGIRVSDEEIKKVLAKIYRDPEGKPTSAAAIKEHMRAYSFTSDREDLLRDLLKRNLAAMHYANALFASARPELQAQLRQVFDAQNRSISFSFAKFDALNYVEGLKYEETNLTNYLGEHKDEFVLADMLVFDTQLYADSLTISEDEIKAYYEANKATEFTNEETRDVRRILVKLAADADEKAKEAADKKIADIYKDLARPGEAFETVARKYSEDESATSEDGVIRGITRQGARDAAFAEAVYALENVNDYNKTAVETADGLEIIQLVATTPGGVQPLEAVKEDIRKNLASAKAGEEASGQADELRRQALNETDWDKLTEPNWVTLQKNVVAITGENELQSTLGGMLTPVGALNDQAPLLATEEGQITDVLPLFDNYVTMKVTGKGDSLPGKFDIIRPAIVKRYTAVKSLEAAKAAAEEFAGNVSSVSSLEAFKAAAGENEVTVEDTESNKYNGVFTYGKEMLDALFDAGENKLVGPLERSRVFFVAYVTKMAEFDEKAFEEQKDMLLQQELGSWFQGQPNMLHFMNIIDKNFAELIDAQVSALINNRDFRLNRELIRQSFGAQPQAEQPAEEQ